MPRWLCLFLGVFAACAVSTWAQESPPSAQSPPSAAVCKSICPLPSQFEAEYTLGVELLNASPLSDEAIEQKLADLRVRLQQASNDPSFIEARVSGMKKMLRSANQPERGFQYQLRWAQFSPRTYRSTTSMGSMLHSDLEYDGSRTFSVLLGEAVPTTWTLSQDTEHRFTARILSGLSGTGYHEEFLGGLFPEAIDAHYGIFSSPATVTELSTGSIVSLPVIPAKGKAGRYEFECANLHGCRRLVVVRQYADQTLDWEAKLTYDDSVSSAVPTVVRLEKSSKSSPTLVWTLVPGTLRPSVASSHLELPAQTVVIDERFGSPFTFRWPGGGLTDTEIAQKREELRQQGEALRERMSRPLANEPRAWGRNLFLAGATLGGAALLLFFLRAVLRKGNS
jgi:hypothetical protein